MVQWLDDMKILLHVNLAFVNLAKKCRPKSHPIYSVAEVVKFEGHFLKRQPQVQREKKIQLLTKKQDIPVPLYTPRIRQTTALLSWDVL